MLLNGSELIEEHLNLADTLLTKGDAVNTREFNNRLSEKLTVIDKNLNRNQLMSALKVLENRNAKLTSKSKQTFEEVDPSVKHLKHDISRSFSLNDLISAANELISQQTENNTNKPKTYLPKSHQNLNKLNEYNVNSFNDEKTMYQKIGKDESSTSAFRDATFINHAYQQQEHCREPFKHGVHKDKLLSSSTKQLIQSSPPFQAPPPFQPSPQLKPNFLPTNKKQHPTHQNQQQQFHGPPSNTIQSILKNSSNQVSTNKHQGSGVNLAPESNGNTTNERSSDATTKSPNETIDDMIEQYKLKQSPKQRLEIDILPSHLSCSKSKLLIASSFGRIRGRLFDTLFC